MAERNSMPTFVGCAAINSIANLTWWLQPLLIAHWVGSGALSESAAGFVVSIEMGLVALSGMILTRILTGGRIVHWVLLGIAGATLAALASLYASTFAALALSRGLVGVGIGLVMMLYYMVAGRLANPDRVFAQIGVINVVFGVVLVGSLSVLTKIWHDLTPLHVMVGALILLTLPACLISRDMRIERLVPTASAAMQLDADDPARIKRLWLLSAVALGLGTVGGISWAFFGVIAARLGMPTADIEHATATGILFAIPVSGLAAWLGTRIGRFWPQAIAVASMTANVLVLNFIHQPWAITLSACLNLGGLYFALPFLFGAGAEQDAVGQGSAYVGSAFTFTGALSPFVGGLVMQYLGPAALTPVAMGIAVLVVAGLAWFEMLSRPIRRVAMSIP